MCNCIRTINKAIAPYNTCLSIPLMVILDTGKNVSGERVMLATEKIDPKKRGRPKALFAAFCPLCGKKYPKQT
jgi:hypothetical protein